LTSDDESLLDGTKEVSSVEYEGDALRNELADLSDETSFKEGLVEEADDTEARNSTGRSDVCEDCCELRCACILPISSRLRRAEVVDSVLPEPIPRPRSSLTELVRNNLS
jgi:hypothetical protein